MIESEEQKCVLPVLLAEFWFSTSILLLRKKFLENISGDVSLYMKMRGVHFEGYCSLTPVRTPAPHSCSLTLPWWDGGGNHNGKTEKNHRLRKRQFNM